MINDIFRNAITLILLEVNKVEENTRLTNDKHTF